jgi:glycosyltransferase involved in cell wall biosynthesis
MRVIMANTFHHRRGGDSTYALSLTQLLESDGHQVIPLAMRHPDNLPSRWDRWFIPWVDYRQHQANRQRLHQLRHFAFTPTAKRSINSLIRQTQPDILHLQNIHHHLTPSIIEPARRASVPVVWTLHDYELICPNGLLFRNGRPCLDCKGHQYFKAVQHRCKRDNLALSTMAAVENTLHHLARVRDKVDRFLCPSNFLRNTLIDFGFAPEKVFHQPNFVRAPPLAHRPRKGWLFAGRLTAEKGLRTILSVAKQLPDHPLTICGTGPLEAEVRAAAQEMPHIKFVGHLSFPELQERLQTAAVIAVPSRWYENFPYAVLEAQTAGAAVVASRLGGISEQIEDGVDGMLLDPTDEPQWAVTIAQLLNEPAKAAALGINGHARVQNSLSAQGHLDNIKKHYDDVRKR